MSRLDDLPPDQRAVLQLLLKQDRTYEEIAQLLRLDAGVVRERAHRALDALGPVDADLPAERRNELGDYLLGEQSATQRAASRAYLEGSSAGRSWARTVAAELRPLGGDILPEIPADEAETEEAFGALHAREARREEVQKSSKLGGILLILGAIAVAVVLIV